MKRLGLFLILLLPNALEAKPRLADFDYRYVRTNANNNNIYEKIVDISMSQVTVILAIEDDKTGEFKEQPNIELTYDCKNRQLMWSSKAKRESWETVLTSDPWHKGFKIACDSAFEPESTPPSGFPWLKNYIKTRSRLLGRVAGLYCARDNGRLSAKDTISEIKRVIATDRLGEEEGWLVSYRGRQAMKVAYDNLLDDCVTLKNRDSLGRALLTWIK